SVLYDREVESPEGKRRFEFERAGGRFEIEAAGLNALGINAWEPDNALSEVGAPARVWHDGVVSERPVPPLVTRTTATPLLVCPQCAVGVTPLRLDLPP